MPLVGAARIHLASSRGPAQVRLLAVALDWSVRGLGSPSYTLAAVGDSLVVLFEESDMPTRAAHAPSNSPCIDV